MSVSLHQLNKTDVVKRLHHLLLIQYILGKLKNRISKEMGIRFFCLVIYGYNALPINPMLPGKLPIIYNIRMSFFPCKEVLSFIAKI